MLVEVISLTKWSNCIINEVQIGIEQSVVSSNTPIMREIDT